ncbi:hypothetical protein HaLaN_06392 [Haematococcus lacustris]|uniref:Uncharacterized protein n=1 Tax=Haematococcus lacustris TaxID=44745 RepID=A0A699YL40_HAELA|nr:hypothetical protein HaLaN_06392 [Haematococcus lacustris]
MGWQMLKRVVCKVSGQNSQGNHAFSCRCSTPTSSCMTHLRRSHDTAAISTSSCKVPFIASLLPAACSQPLRILAPKGTEVAFAMTMDQIMAATKVRFVPSFASVRDIPGILLDSLAHNSSVDRATYDAVVYASSSLGDLARGGALVDMQPYIKNDPKQVIAWSDLPPFESSLASKFGNNVSVALLLVRAVDLGGHGLLELCQTRKRRGQQAAHVYANGMIGPM